MADQDANWHLETAVGHGNFLAWIDAEFGMSTQSAANLMNVAKRFGDQNPNNLEFQPTVLYALAAPSTPDEVWIANEVDAGQASGEVATKGQRANVRDEDISDYSNLGIDRRRVSEWREVRDA